MKLSDRIDITNFIKIYFDTILKRSYFKHDTILKKKFKSL